MNIRNHVHLLNQVLLCEITGCTIAIIPLPLTFKRAEVVKRGMAHVLESNLYYLLTMMVGGGGGVTPPLHNL